MSPPIHIFFSINIMAQHTLWMILAVAWGVGTPDPRAVQGRLQIANCAWNKPQVVGGMFLSLPLSCFVSRCIFCDDQLLRRSDVFPGTLSCWAFPVCWEGGFRDWSTLSWFSSSNAPTLFFVPSVQTFWFKKKKKKAFSNLWGLCSYSLYLFLLYLCWHFPPRQQ